MDFGRLWAIVSEQASLSRFGRQAEGEEGSTEGNIICLFLRMLLSPPAPPLSPADDLVPCVCVRACV